MILQKVFYSLVMKDGLNFVYVPNILGQASQFNTYEEALEKKKAFVMSNIGEKVYVLKETREILYDKLDEEFEQFTKKSLSKNLEELQNMIKEDKSKKKTKRRKKK